MSGRLDGRVVIITGGARGQGASHAERLAEDGAHVLCGDVLDTDGEQTAARLRDRGLSVEYRRLDVTSPTDWEAAIEWVQHRHGRLDVLVNNAGIIHVNDLVDERLDDWNRTLTINTTGTLLGMQAVVPLMRETGGGSIINIASIFGVAGAPGYIAYCASKGAIIAMSKVAALELAGDKIRVNSVCPGGVSTPMNADEPEGGVVPLTPWGRRADVSEISGVIAFLASNDAVFITGTEIVVDGGYLAR
jgi:NAD(P)-dependent dehydrogenase (short-subunit alcohol dehydrogenase family)